MTESTQSRTDIYLRFTRRGLVGVLFMIVIFGAIGLAGALQPHGAFAANTQRFSWVIPIAIAVLASSLITFQRRHRFTPDSPEVNAVMKDELRRANMDRARAAAFVIILLVQVPMALFLSRWPSFAALLAMAVATITIAMSSLIVFFLAFDRD